MHVLWQISFQRVVELLEALLPDHDKDPEVVQEDKSDPRDHDPMLGPQPLQAPYQAGHNGCFNLLPMFFSIRESVEAFGNQRLCVTFSRDVYVI